MNDRLTFRLDGDRVIQTEPDGSTTEFDPLTWGSFVRGSLVVHAVRIPRPFKVGLDLCLDGYPRLRRPAEADLDADLQPRLRGPGRAAGAGARCVSAWPTHKRKRAERRRRKFAARRYHRRARRGER